MGWRSWSKGMCVGVVGERIVLWLGPEGATKALAEHPAAQPMDFTGRVMRTMIFLDPAGVRSDAELTDWLRQALYTVAARPT